MAVGLNELPARLLKDFHEWRREIEERKDNSIAEEMDNYNSISVLSVVSKVLERKVHTQWYRFFHEKKILSPYQCGFRKGCSTESAVISFIDYIYTSMDQGLLTSAVFIKLRKASHWINHELLLEKW